MPLHTSTVTLMHSVHVVDKVNKRSDLSNVVVSVCICAGNLCGECRDGRGVSALLNNCVTCNNAQGLLILALSMST